MTLPALTREQRAQIGALSTAHMRQGTARLADGSEAMERALRTGNEVEMERSVALMEEGVDELGAGVAARRALSEGHAPRNLALDWFRREMNLASPVPREERGGLLGLTPFHLLTMVLLIAFALVMIGLYFLKMRRAAALFGRLEAGAGSPPPGSAPPLAGTPTRATSGPAAPPTTPAPATPPPATPPPATPPPATPPPATPPPAAPPPATSAPPAKPPGGAPATSGPSTAKWRGQLRVESILVETPMVKTLRLRPPIGDSVLPFTFVPGQFLNVAFSIGGARMNRSYTISSSPNRRAYVDLTVKREPRGAVSRHMTDLLEVGDDFEASGPVGRFTFDGSEAESVVLISGGVGVTPMMCITRYLTESSWPGEIFFVYACRSPAEYIFANELRALEQGNPNLHVVVTMSDAEVKDWDGPRGRLTKELLSQSVPALARRRVHLCGPVSMMEAARALLDELGVPPEQVKTESFGATKPTPSAPGTSPKPTLPATGPLVTFTKNAKSSKIHTDQTVLELSEELAIGIEFACRVGTCGVCKVKMTSGEVDMAIEDALDANDKSTGIILACQAKPKSDIAVEA